MKVAEGRSLGSDGERAGQGHDPRIAEPLDGVSDFLCKSAVLISGGPGDGGRPLVQVLRFKPATFELAVTRFEAARGEWVWIYDAPRTVVDLIRMRRRFGDALAYAVLNLYLSSAAGRRRLLMEYASQLGAQRAVRFALDVITAS